MLIAATYANTLDPYGKLNGYPSNVLIRTEHDCMLTTVGLRPLQLIGSEVKVTPSTCLI
jgi:hypothetical protein